MSKNHNTRVRLWSFAGVANSVTYMMGRVVKTEAQKSTHYAGNNYEVTVINTLLYLALL